jgi:hypothetical protein
MQEICPVQLSWSSCHNELICWWARVVGTIMNCTKAKISDICRSSSYISICFFKVYTIFFNKIPTTLSYLFYASILVCRIHDFLPQYSHHIEYQSNCSDDKRSNPIYILKSLLNTSGTHIISSITAHKFVNWWQVRCQFISCKVWTVHIQQSANLWVIENLRKGYVMICVCQAIKNETI